MKMKKYGSVDEYIESFPENVQEILKTLRRTIKSAAPQATEDISYGMPVYKQNGNLVYFGGFKDHVSFFPTGGGVEAFKKEIGEYVTGKGTASFPLDKPLPLDLITKIVEYRVQENTDKGNK